VVVEMQDVRMWDVHPKIVEKETLDLPFSLTLLLSYFDLMELT
jgi:hypothetical protein